MRKAVLAICLFGLVLAIARSQPGDHPAVEYQWNLPRGFPKPIVPPDNPMTVPKIELGRRLFYDVRLSVNGKASCATCHKQELAFTDGRPVAIGATGEAHSRGAMSLVNVAYASSLTWSNPLLKELERQALTPMFGEHPVEMGLPEDESFHALRVDTLYRSLFAKAFPNEENPINAGNITKALACFERSIISARSPYDRYHYGGDDSAVSEAAKRGEILYFSQPLSCFRCHGGFNFSDAAIYQGSRHETEYHNTGLYNLKGLLSYPSSNPGIYEVTHIPADVGKFKAPTLRNIAVTAPYMHDGSIRTLEDVLEHYAAGGRTIHSGPNAGIGHDNPNKDPLIGGFPLSSADRADLIAFLESLTDEAVLHDPRFSDPWPDSAR